MKRLTAGEIGTKELFALLVTSSAADLYLTFPQFLGQVGGEAAWILPLVAGALICLLWFALCRRATVARGEDIVEKSAQAFGRIGGAVVVLVLVLFLVVTAASVARQFTETIVTTILPHTPVSAITICFMLTAAYFAYAGLEGLGRLNLLVGPVVLFGTLLLLALVIPWAEPRYLLPWVGNGPRWIVLGSGWTTSIFLNILLLMLIYPSLNEPARGSERRIGIVSTAVVSLLLSGVAAIYTMVFSSAVTNSIPFPLYHLARLIYFGRFFQRMESGFMFFWVTVIVLKVAICLWASCYMIARVARMPVYRPIVPAVSMCVYTLSFIPQSFMTALYWQSAFMERYGGLMVIALPALVWLGAEVRSRFKRKGESRHGTPRRAAQGAH